MYLYLESADIPLEDKKGEKDSEGAAHLFDKLSPAWWEGELRLAIDGREAGQGVRHRCVRVRSCRGLCYTRERMRGRLFPVSLRVSVSGCRRCSSSGSVTQTPESVVKTRPRAASRRGCGLSTRSCSCGRGVGGGGGTLEQLLCLLLFSLSFSSILGFMEGKAGGAVVRERARRSALFSSSLFVGATALQQTNITFYVGRSLFREGGGNSSFMNRDGTGPAASKWFCGQWLLFSSVVSSVFRSRMGRGVLFGRRSGHCGQSRYLGQQRVPAAHSCTDRVSSSA